MSVDEYIDIYAALSERNRMKILLTIYSAENFTLSFNELKRKIGLNSGALSYHLKIPQDAGFIENILSRRSRTLSQYKLTNKGVKALEIPKILYEVR